MSLSSHFGATEILQVSEQDALGLLRETTQGQLVDLVVEAAGELSAINLAIDLVRKHGHILFFGYPRCQFMPFNFEQFFHKCCRAITIVGAAEELGQPSTRLALEIIARKEIDVDPMLTHRFPFEQVLSAYEMHRTRSDGAVKILVEGAA